MPLLLADFIYSRDCKLNLRKNVDTTRKAPPVHSNKCCLIGGALYFVIELSE